jgi:death-on-curing protein
MNSIGYLTVDQVIILHRDALAAYGGLSGLRSEHQLASAVFQPQASAFGEDAYPSVVEKAAAYGFFIAESQPFIDGNKQTAALAMLTFLYGNGYELNTPDDEALAIVFENLGARRLTQQEFFAWVIEHARAM